MDTKDYKAKEYHKMVWEEAKKEARNQLWGNKRQSVGDIIAIVVAGYASSVILDIWSNTVTTPPIIQITSILIGTIAGLAALYFYRLILNRFWVVPEKLFREKEVQANKFTWNDVDINIDEPTIEDKPTIYLNVINTKPYNIEQVEVLVVEITEDWLDQNRVTLPLNLCWSLGTGKPFFGKIQLDKNSVDPTGLALAYYLEKHVYASLIMGKPGSEEDVSEREDFLNLKEDCEYRIKLQWCGEISNQKLDEFYKSYLLRFDGSKIHIKELR